MLKRFLTPLLVSALLSSGCTPSGTNPESCEALPPSVLARLEPFVTERLEAEHVTGLSLVIIQEGRTVCLKGYGLANLETNEPMTTKTRMSIGSTTKAMTALALMQQVEAGKVDLEAPVTRYLPWFRTADGLQEQILLKHLLTHSSGLPRSLVWEGSHDEGAIERRVRSLADVKLRFPPGQGYEYSNDGFTVLGLIVQTVAGKPYARYMEDSVFTPLGMTHTLLDPASTQGPDMAQAYVWTRGQLYQRAPPTSGMHSPAGTVTYSSAEDVARYLSALLAGGEGVNGRVLSTQGLERMWQPLVLPHSGMGWELSEASGRRRVSHEGNTATGSSMFLMFPAERTAVAVLDNRNSRISNHVAEGVAALLFGEEPPPVTPSQERPASTFVPDPQVWQDYVGSFDTAVGRVDITVEGEHLWATFGMGVPSIRAELEAYGDNDFVLRDEYAVFEGKTMSFRHEPDGRLGMLFQGQPIGQRVP